MRKIRFILIVLGATAGTLLTFHKLPYNPIFRGYDIDFSWQKDAANRRIILSADPEGNMPCTIRLKVTAQGGPYTASASTGQPLHIVALPPKKDKQWIVIEKDGAGPAVPFDWLSGETIFVYGGPEKTGAGLQIFDWYVYPANKNFDSKQRAEQRIAWFYVSLVLSIVAIVQAVIEIKESRSVKHEPLTPENCMRALIQSVEGPNSQDTEKIQELLGKVLMQGVSARNAVEELHLKPLEGMQMWFIARRKLLERLKFLLESLAKYDGLLRN